MWRGVGVALCAEGDSQCRGEQRSIGKWFKSVINGWVSCVLVGLASVARTIYCLLDSAGM